MDPVTTQAPATDAPVETAPSDGGTQDAVTDGANTEPSTEPTPTDGGDDLGVGPVSLDGIPEILRPKVEAQLKEYEKQFKSAYTKKTMSMAEERRQREADYQRVNSEKERLEQLAVEVLQNPEKLDAYRKIYGLDKRAPAEDVEEKPIQTVEDVLNAVDQKVNTRLAAEVQQLKSQAAAEQAQAAAINRWESALTGMRADPTFKKYEKIIVNMADDAKYKQMYTGRNEKDILAACTADLKALFRDDLAAAKNEGINTVAAKKSAATVMPGKTPQTVQTSPGQSRQEILDRIRARIGKPT